MNATSHPLRKILVTCSSLLFVLAIVTLPLLPKLVMGADAKPTSRDDLRRYSNGGFSLVQCDGVPTPGTNEVKCDFAALINQVKFLMRWMFYISIPIAVGLFAYAGGLFMTANPGKIKDAKKIFSHVVVGFIIMLLAWLIVRTILYWVAEPGYGTQILE